MFIRTRWRAALYGAGHGERGRPARAGAGWGAASGGAAVSPGRPPTASASVTLDFLGAATRTAPRATEVHNILGNWDVDNNPAVGHAGKRATRMLDSLADQLDGPKSWCMSVQRQVCLCSAKLQKKVMAGGSTSTTRPSISA